MAVIGIYQLYIPYVATSCLQYYSDAYTDVWTKEGYPYILLLAGIVAFVVVGRRPSLANRRRPSLYSMYTMYSKNVFLKNDTKLFLMFNKQEEMKPTKVSGLEFKMASLKTFLAIY